MKRSEKGRPRLSTTRGPGKRVGPAEIESVLVESKKIVEAAVIGIPDEIKGQVPVAFVVPKPGADQGEEKVKKLKEFVASRLGKTLILRDIYFVSDLPKRRNAKVMRRVIKPVFIGEDPGDLQALINPEVIEEIRDLGKNDKGTRS